MSDLLPLWNSEEDDLLVCRQVRDETHDVRTFIFDSMRPSRFAFQAGQFLTFTFPLDAGPVSRCYTIASPPTRPGTVSITVKRVPGGPVSNWLHDRLRPGMRVNAIGPLGAFTCDATTARKLLLLSAGSGITPLMSMARAQDDLALGTDILFVHSAHSPADIIFRDEQALIARHRGGMRAIAICSDDAPGESWGGYRGRITTAMLTAIAPDLHEREIYLCGPAGYMASVRTILSELGFDPDRLHQESFDFAALDEDPALPAPAPEARSYDAEFTRTRRTVACAPGQTILQAARAAGLRLPSSCTKGMCGTCKSRLASGTVSMQHAGGIRQREIDAGMILICCSRPTSDVVIER